MAQLCLFSYVYPGADYKRSVHVLQAYDLARQLVTHLYTNPTFRVLVDSRSAQQLLATVLLPDIHHFPFLHIFQESSIPGLNKLQVVDLFCNGEATGEKEADAPSIYDLLADLGIESDRFKRLIFDKHHEQKGTSIEVDQIISSILNSGVDVDKLSYLLLDSYFTGVQYGGGIDFPCILQAATLGRLGAHRAPHIAFTERAVQALENVVMTRFWNFKSLYWHHTNRALMAMILSVVRRLYVQQGRAVQDYLLQTMWLNDLEAVRFLDKQFQSQLGQASILSGLVEDRGRIYKRLYTVRAGMGDDADNALYSEFRRLNYGSEIAFCRHIASRLSDYLGKELTTVPLGDNEVLIDIPRREMDSGGPVYVATSDNRVEPLSNISDPIRSITANYERLTKRVRIFVSPMIARVLNKHRRIEERKILQGMVKEAIDETLGKSQVR